MPTVQPWFEAISCFFAQLDWKNPSTYLGILGAVGAPSTIYHAARWAGRFWHTTFLRVRHPSIHKDFYYKSRDFGYRVMEDGTTYLNVRRETIIPLSKTVSGVPVTYRWTGSGDITETVLPNTVTIQDAQRIVGKMSIRRSVHFQGGLEKGKEYSYTLLLSCKATNHQPDSFLASRSSRRVDNLTLRVAFPIDKRPAHVTYRVLDSDGTERERLALELSDPLTGEYRKEIRYPRPFFEHRIEWE
jgi:hypothetical protein